MHRLEIDYKVRTEEKDSYQRLLLETIFHHRRSEHHRQNGESKRVPEFHVPHQRDHCHHDFLYDKLKFL